MLFWLTDACEFVVYPGREAEVRSMDLFHTTSH